MHWFIDPIKYHYADFEGRVTRRPFWLYVLIFIVINVALSVAEDFMLLGNSVLTGLYGLILLVPSLALTARRLHDIGKSGWWQLLWFIPIVGWIILIVFLAQDTSMSDNAYGPNPKGAVVQTPVTPTPTA